MVHKEDMDSRNPRGTQNERKLWHGTASTSVNSINTEQNLGHRTARIRLQGQSKDVYQADSRIKEILHKTKAELMEQQEAVMLAQFVSVVLTFY